MISMVQTGTKVRYHGSLLTEHGEYVVDGWTLPTHSPDMYPGGIAWDLVSIENPEKKLWNVRRSSFTVIEEG